MFSWYLAERAVEPEWKSLGARSSAPSPSPCAAGCSGRTSLIKSGPLLDDCVNEMPCPICYIPCCDEIDLESLGFLGSLAQSGVNSLNTTKTSEYFIACICPYTSNIIPVTRKAQSAGPKDGASMFSVRDRTSQIRVQEYLRLSPLHTALDAPLFLYRLSITKGKVSSKLFCLPSDSGFGNPTLS